MLQHNISFELYFVWLNSFEQWNLIEINVHCYKTCHLVDTDGILMVYTLYLEGFLGNFFFVTVDQGLSSNSSMSNDDILLSILVVIGSSYNGFHF